MEIIYIGNPFGSTDPDTGSKCANKTCGTHECEKYTCGKNDCTGSYNCGNDSCCENGDCGEEWD